MSKLDEQPGKEVEMCRGLRDAALARISELGGVTEEVAARLGLAVEGLETLVARGRWPLEVGFRACVALDLKIGVAVFKDKDGGP